MMMTRLLDTLQTATALSDKWYGLIIMVGAYMYKQVTGRRGCVGRRSVCRVTVA